MKPLLLVGAGGHGRVVADVAELSGWAEICFVDDRWPDLKESGPWSVIAALRNLSDHLTKRDVFVSIGANGPRLELHRQIGAPAPTIVHPSAVVSRYASVGAGTVVLANAVVNAGARIGEAVIVNTAATIDHDCIIADGAHISPGAHLAGNVRVGERTWVGIGAAVRDGIAIGSDVIVGAGASVVSEVADGMLVVGVPAKPSSFQ